MLVIISDQHSAYERTAQVVARIDRLRAENPQLPLAFLIDGDVFELGNGVARRSAGVVDFAMLAALAQRAPTVLNLGNHEPEFFEMEETVARLRATGVTVIGNITNPKTGALFAPDSLPLQLGRRQAVVVGMSTDLLASFRGAVRPSLELAEPVAWGKKHLPALLVEGSVKIVLSHAGLLADRPLLPLVPAGTLFVGAHDHLRFVHREGRTVYLQSGAWNESLTLAYLRFDAGGPEWEVQQERIETTGPVDAKLAALIHETEAKYLTAEDRVVVGNCSRALGPEDAARLAVHAVRLAAGADAAFVGRTTFGSGLPVGDVSRAALDAWVRFDSVICVAEVSGVQLQAMLAGANEDETTPFVRRQGDYLVAEGPAPIEPSRRYRIATTDWVARDPRRYLGTTELTLQPQPNLRLKTIAADALKTRP